MSGLAEVTDASFAEDVLAAGDTVLVEFWADWCPPCKVLTPVLEAVASEGHPGFRIVKMNSDENIATAAAYRILSVPTMKVFRGGEVVKTVVGAKPLAALRAELAEFLG